LYREKNVAVHKSLSSCADFVSAASTSNEEFASSSHNFFTLELVNLFTISNAVLVAVWN